MSEFGDDMQTCFTHRIGRRIVAKMTIQHKMPDRQELFNSIRDNARQTLQDGRDRPRYDP